MNTAFAIYLSCGAWLCALVGYGAYYRDARSQWKRMGLGALWTGGLGLTLILGLRWWNSGRAPISNMYESLMALNWGITAVFLFLQGRLKVTGLGFWAACLSLGVMALAFLMDNSIQPLAPAPQSQWLVFHVVVSMLGYASLGLAALAGGLVLVCFSEERLANDPVKIQKGVSLDAFSIRAVNLGFVSLTAGIALGSVWANEAWGSCWSWDPKETWSLITWFYYAALIYLGRSWGWRGTRLAWLNVGGAALVAFTYFGVHYLFSGLHSHGRG